MADQVSTNPISGHTVFGVLLITGGEIVLYRMVQGKWLTATGDFVSIESLVIVFMFLAILSTFAPQLAGALSLLVLTVMSIKLLPEIMKGLK